ncbi:unnamed protein product [Owenia fusiformis]|uniref:Uncharacterized protein n=1 Tax=Owenia fusiformis TaxID=6347 RepID=A0A8J1Y104_OWEFU|nr:unnamed protein product [Owenia fusiformis]
MLQSNFRNTKFKLLCIMIVALFDAVISDGPYGCEDLDFGIYECDFRLVSTPFNSADFFPQKPQQLTLKYVNRPLTSGLFAAFADIDTDSFVMGGEPARLDIVCSYGVSLMMDPGAFTGLNWIQAVSFSRCQLVTFPESAFAAFGTLDSLAFYGGTLGNVDRDGLKGLNIAEDTSLFDPKGEIVFDRAQFSSGRIPFSFLSHAKNASSVILNSNGVKTIDALVLDGFFDLKRLTLSGQQFDSLPSDTFYGLDGLGHITMDRMPWECTCENAWFFTWAFVRKATLEGDLICNGPADYKGQRFRVFNNVLCPSVDEDSTATSIDLFGISMEIYDLVSYCVTIIALVISIIGLAIACHNKKRLSRVTPVETLTSVKIDKTNQSKVTGGVKGKFQTAVKKITKPVGKSKGNAWG